MARPNKYKPTSICPVSSLCLALRLVPAYALTVGKNGPSLQPTPEGTCVVADTAQAIAYFDYLASQAREIPKSCSPPFAYWYPWMQNQSS
jgi:hypothetical protein